MKKMKLTLILISLLILTFSNNVYATEEFYFCETNALIAFRILGYVIIMIKIVVPLIIIGQSMLDIFTAVISGEIKDLGTTLVNFVKRVVAGFIIFFLPSIIFAVMGLVDSAEKTRDSFDVCNNCIFTPNGEKCTKGIAAIK